MTIGVLAQSIKAQDSTLVKAGSTVLQRIHTGFFSRRAQVRAIKLPAERWLWSYHSGALLH